MKGLERLGSVIRVPTTVAERIERAKTARVALQERVNGFELKARAGVEAFRATGRTPAAPEGDLRYVEPDLRYVDPLQWVGKARTDALPVLQRLEGTRADPLQLKGNLGPFKAQLSRKEVEPGVEEVTLRLDSETAAPPPGVILDYQHPFVDSTSVWSPGSEQTSAAARDSSIPADWGFGAVVSRVSSKSPVSQLLGPDGTNRVTLASSDTVHVNVIKPGVVEESAGYQWRVAPFDPDATPAKTHEVKLRIDRRTDVPWSQALGDVTAWQYRSAGRKPTYIPPRAHEDAFSTWYWSHKDIDEAELVAEMERYRQLGVKKIIIDDGHQETPAQRVDRSYSRTGASIKAQGLPNLKKIIERAHQNGQQILLWDPIAFIGKNIEEFGQFKDKLLFYQEHTDGGVFRGVGILDPRYPEVRELIVRRYVDALKELNVDGFKIDFLDNFKARAETPRGMADGRDFASIDEAVAKLLDDVHAELTAIKPDIELEVRQASVGVNVPGSFKRNNDAPLDSTQNRVGIASLRALDPQTPAAGDMLIWHRDEPVQAAARHIHNSLFGQAQFSNKLTELSKEHYEMLKFWLGFRREHEDVRLRGSFAPGTMDESVPLIRARTADKELISLHADHAVRFDAETPRTALLVNDSSQKELLFDLADSRRVRVFDVFGKPAGGTSLSPGAHKVMVPKGGYAQLDKVD